jgi:hypothetical protein
MWCFSRVLTKFDREMGVVYASAEKRMWGAWTQCGATHGYTEKRKSETRRGAFVFSSCNISGSSY